MDSPASARNTSAGSVILSAVKLLGHLVDVDQLVREIEVPLSAMVERIVRRAVRAALDEAKQQEVARDEAAG